MGYRQCSTCSGVGRTIKSASSLGMIGETEICYTCGGLGHVHQLDPPVSQPVVATPRSRPQTGGSGGTLLCVLLLVMLGVVFGAANGLPIVGMAVLCAIGGLLLMPLLRVVVWIASGVLKLVFYAAILLLVLVLLSTAFGTA